MLKIGSIKFEMHDGDCDIYNVEREEDDELVFHGFFAVPRGLASDKVLAAVRLYTNLFNRDCQLQEVLKDKNNITKNSVNSVYLDINNKLLGLMVNRDLSLQSIYDRLKEKKKHNLDKQSAKSQLELYMEINKKLNLVQDLLAEIKEDLK